ncbi:CreA family protein [Salaquimonas pukyongi]|uniref:CreA family protein n=1 Tax=Salaquimonas pukyongi TaxID=2712698 RepID=UPI00096B7B7A|nr:CreA family protein [Salaquimonas pukyongi]
MLHQASAAADEIGKIGVDWLGNDIVVEAVDDPDVKGVTCHLAYFERGIIDRLQQGNWFEDPSNSAIECRQSGPIEVGEIEQDSNGEEIFKSGRSLIWKKLVVKRLYDRERNMLVYLAHSREVSQGSAKMSISTVKLPDSAVVQ